MVVKSVLRSYDGVQRSFHWIMAALILGALAIGFVVYFVVGDGPLRVPMLTIHKSLGMTALILGALRIVYRLSVGAPPYAVPLGRLIHKASQAGHLALYALMLATPIVGYIASSAGGYEISWFGLFDFPGWRRATTPSCKKPLACISGWAGRSPASSRSTLRLYSGTLA